MHFYFPTLMPLISLVLCAPTVTFPIFILQVSTLLLLKFPSYYIPVFQSLLFPYLFHLPLSFLLFPGFSLSVWRVYLFLDVFPFAWGSAWWRHLRDGTRYPTIDRPPFFRFVLDLPVCFQFAVLPTHFPLNFIVPKHFSTSDQNSPVSLRSVLSFR